MELLYLDNKIVVCVKPAGVLSTDEPGGMPSRLRTALGGETAPIYTVHRLDAAVGGVMVYARTRHAASDLGKAIQTGAVRKEYLAAACGALPLPDGELCDLLRRDRSLRKTFVAEAPGKDVREARLGYQTLAGRGGLWLYRVRLYTGRPHQIRCQFASRGCPVVGDRKYGTLTDGDCDIALWSHEISFTHPETGERLHFSAEPPATWPWTAFE